MASDDNSVVSSGGMRTVTDVSITVEPWLFLSIATHLYSAPRLYIFIAKFQTEAT